MNFVVPDASDDENDDDHRYSIRIRSAPLLRRHELHPNLHTARSAAATPIPLHTNSSPSTKPILPPFTKPVKHSASPVTTQRILSLPITPPTTSISQPSLKLIETPLSKKIQPSLPTMNNTTNFEDNASLARNFEVDSLIKNVRDLIDTIQTEPSAKTATSETKSAKKHMVDRDPKQFAADKLFSRIKDIKESKFKYKMLEQQVTQRKLQDHKAQMQNRKNHTNFVKENTLIVRQFNPSLRLESTMQRNALQNIHLQEVKLKSEQLLEQKKLRWKLEIEKKYTQAPLRSNGLDIAKDEKSSQLWAKTITVLTFVDAVHHEMQLRKQRHMIQQREIDAVNVIKKLFIPIIQRRRHRLMQRFVKAMRKNMICFVINFRIRKKRKAASIIISCLKIRLESSIFTSHVFKFMKKVRLLQKLFRNTSQIRKSQLLLLRLQFARVEQKVVEELLRNDEEELRIKVCNEIQKLKNDTLSTTSSKTKSIADTMKQTNDTVLEYKKKVKEIIDLILKDKKDKSIDQVLTLIQSKSIPFELLIQVGEIVGMYIKRRVTETDDKIKETLLYNNLLDRIRYYGSMVRQHKQAMATEKLKKRELLRLQEKTLVKTPSGMLREMMEDYKNGDTASVRSSKVSFARSQMNSAAVGKLSSFKTLLDFPVMEALVRRGLELSEQLIKESLS